MYNCFDIEAIESVSHPGDRFNNTTNKGCKPIKVRTGCNSMLTRTTAKNQASKSEDFDPIAFEAEREKIFFQTEKIVCSSKYFQYSPDFSEGEWDAKINAEPSLSRWGSADYRRGFLTGIEEKYNDRFAQLI